MLIYGFQLKESTLIFVVYLPSRVWLFCDPMDCSLSGSSVHDFPGKNTCMGCHSFLQGIFLTQGSNPCLLHWQADYLSLSHQGSSIHLDNQEKSNTVHLDILTDSYVAKTTIWPMIYTLPFCSSCSKNTSLLHSTATSN